MNTASIGSALTVIVIMIMMICFLTVIEAL